MSSILERHKPAAAARTHLLLAALLWTAVGAVLLGVGAYWASGAPIPYRPLLLGLAVGIGLLKAHFVLSRTARRGVGRIRSRGDGRCIGGFLSLPTWAFVAVMMLAGYLLRHGLLPRGIVGVVYVAIGTALLVAARRLWRAWYGFGGS
jgi:hypothetical protein